MSTATATRPQPRSSGQATILAGLLISLPAVAPAQSAPIAKLDEVVVTARKYAERIQDVPSAVSAVGAADMTRVDARSAMDLTALAPGLQTPKNAVSFNAPQFFIRGAGQGDNNWNTENSVAVFVDDIYLQSTAGSWIDILDFDRIEILRGPQGTLYGRNSTSGAIKFVPRLPDLHLARSYAEIVGGSHARVDLKAGINAPLIDGVLGMKADVFRTATDGYLTRVDLANTPIDNTVGRQLHYGGRLALLWRPRKRVEFELNADIVRQRDGTNLITPIAPGDPTSLAELLSKRGDVQFTPVYGVNRGAFEPLTRDGGSQQDGYGIVFKGKVESPIGDFRSISGWRAYKEHFLTQLGGLGAPSTILGVTLYGNVNSHTDVRQFTQEFQLTSEQDRRVTYTAGAYFFYNHWIESEYDATNGVPANFSPVKAPGESQSYGGSYNDIEQRSRSYALYLDFDWRITDKLTISVAGRQTWDYKRLFFNTLFEDHVLEYPGFPVLTGKNWSRFTPRVEIAWRPGRNTLAYASYAEGYKVGAIEGARSSDPATVSHWLAPEIANTWEVGLKADWMRGRLRTNFSLYDSDYVNRADLISPDRVAVANIRVRGLDAEITYVPVSGVRLYAVVGLLDAKYTHAEPDHPIFKPDPTGFVLGYNAQPVMSPKYTLNVGAEYGFDLGRIGSLTVESSVRAVGRHYNALGLNNYDSEIVAAYVVADASCTYRNRNKNVLVTVGIHNIADSTYYTTGFLGNIPEFAGRYYADGRSWFVRTRYDF